MMKLSLTIKNRWWFGMARSLLTIGIMLGLTDAERAGRWLAKNAIRYRTTEERERAHGRG